MSDPTQAQAEDRRAQIQALYDDLMGRVGGYPIEDWANEALVVLAALSVENKRLSRVEQALREVLEWCDGMIDEIRECHDSEEVWKYVVQNPRFGELNKSVKSALSASPEAQPEEGR